MKIAIQRTGGFAGLLEELASVDTAQMPPEEAQGIEKLVGNTGFFRLPTTLGGEIKGADLYHLRITITDGSRRHSVEFPDHDSPELAPLRALVRSVTP